MDISFPSITKKQTLKNNSTKILEKSQLLGMPSQISQGNISKLVIININPLNNYEPININSNIILLNIKYIIPLKDIQLINNKTSIKNVSHIQH